MNSSIDSSELESSVSALLTWKKLQPSKTPESPQQTDDILYLVLTLKTVLAKPLQSIPHKIPLPHPLTPLPNLCLIIPDSPKQSTNKLSLDDVHKKIKSEDLPISKVIKLAKLRLLCSTSDSRQEFCDSYDLFLADERIVKFLPSILGKVFYKKKCPIPVGLKPRIASGLSWKEEVEKACCCEILSFGSGTCHSVRVGESGMGGSRIVENVRAAVEGIVEFVPKKWRGIAAIHLKYSESLAMPLYQKDQKSATGLRSGEGEMRRKDDGGKKKLVMNSR